MEDATISNDDDQRGDGITASDLRRSYFVYAPIQAKGNNVTTLVPDPTWQQRGLEGTVELHRGEGDYFRLVVDLRGEGGKLSMDVKLRSGITLRRAVQNLLALTRHVAY
jgi:hypothetical protein